MPSIADSNVATKRDLLSATHGSIYNVMHYGAVGDGSTDDSTAIQAAIDAAFAAGGGVVFIPALTFIVGTAIVPKNGVILQGSGFSVADATYNRTASDGTILQAPSSGSNMGVAYNTGARGSQPTGLENWNEALHTFQVKDIAFRLFSTGIAIGGDANPGCFNCAFENLWFDNFTGWAMRMENASLSRFQNIMGGNAVSGVTGDVLLQNSITVYNHGNNYVDQVFFEDRQANSRGFEIAARGAGVKNNDNQLYRIQINRDSHVSTSSVNTNGTSTFAFVTAAEASDYPVDMPCSLHQADAQGLEKYRTVFVTSNDGSGNITLSNKAGGTNIVATGTGTITLRQFGFAAMSLVGYGDNKTVGGEIQATGLFGIDLEGHATCQFLAQNAFIEGHIGTIGGVQDTPSAKCSSVICLRNAKGTLNGQVMATFDIDDESDNSGFSFFGWTINGTHSGQNPEPIVQNYPRGMVAYLDADGFTQSGMSLVGRLPSNINITYPSLHNQMVGVPVQDSSFVYMQSGFGLRQWSENTSEQLTENHVGIGACRSAAAGPITWTLPPLDGVPPGTKDSLIGCIFGFINHNHAGVGAGLLVIRTYQGEVFTTAFATSTSEINLAAASALKVNSRVQLTTTGTLPTGLSLLTNYWVIEKVDADTVKLSTSKGGTAVTFSDDGTGTHTVTVTETFNKHASKASITLDRGDSLLIQAMFDMTDNSAFWAVLSYTDHSALP